MQWRPRDSFNTEARTQITLRTFQQPGTMATNPQSLDDTAKAHVSTRVTKLIQATTAKSKAELPLHSIVAAGFSKQHKLVSTLASQISAQAET